MISLQRYTALFAHREIRATFTASAIGRLPIGVTGLAILLLVQMSSGSFARGGAAAGCYVAGLALLAPGLGRAIDRIGPAPILLACSVLFPAALVALVAAVAHGAGALALFFRRRCGGELSPTAAVPGTFRSPASSPPRLR